MNFLDDLHSRPLLADGAMGTEIHARGIDFDQCFDGLNLTQPEMIGEIHRAYIAAGADIIESNTFSATALHLDKWGLADSARAINSAGVAIARQAVAECAAGRHVYVAGSVGPTGAQLAPLGSLQPEEAYAAFHTQISGLVEAGCDLLLLETFSDLAEIEQAIRAARAICDLPIVASMTFNREGRTLLGNTPEDAAARLHALGAQVIGANCSVGPRGIAEMIGRYRVACDKRGITTLPISAMPNAGYPESRGERLIYPATPEYFADYARRFVEAGARLIGGCCGTTPVHIAAMRRGLDAGASAAPLRAISVVAQETPDETAPASHPTALAQRLAAGKFVITVEMEPPRSADTLKLESNARLLRDAGATMLNISDMPMARMRMAGLAAALRVSQVTGLETVLHFPVRGRNLLRVQGDLLAAHTLDMRNLFVTMGDPASIGDYPQAFDSHDIVPTGLVQLIKESFNTGRDSAGASIGAPCSFVVGVAANLTPADLDKEARLLKKKIDSGADFALTQPVFDPTAARAFLAHYRALFGPLTLPILAGVLPLASLRHAVFLKNEVPGMMLPDDLLARMERAGDAARAEGAKIAGEAIEQLREFARGIYFIPAFARYDTIARLIENIGQL